MLDPTKTKIELTNRAYDVIDTQVELLKQLNYAMPFADNSKIITANVIQVGSLGGSVG